MKKLIVKFFGNRQDPFGMPLPYHVYFVVASRSNAMAIPALIGTPAPRHNHQSGQVSDRAFEKMLEALRNSEENIGLKESVQIMSDK
jgi:hypothetical protein